MNCWIFSAMKDSKADNFAWNQMNNADPATLLSASFSSCSLRLQSVRIGTLRTVLSLIIRTAERSGTESLLRLPMSTEINAILSNIVWLLEQGGKGKYIL